METPSQVDASTGNGTELERCFVVDCNHEVMYMCHCAPHAELSAYECTEELNARYEFFFSQARPDRIHETCPKLWGVPSEVALSSRRIRRELTPVSLAAEAITPLSAKKTEVLHLNMRMTARCNNRWHEA